MKYVNVLFPLNIGPLAYMCPENLSDTIKPGMIVAAPLKNRLEKGIVIGEVSSVMQRDIKNIQALASNIPVLSNKMISLLTWMSEYYMLERGLVLKNMLPFEAFTKVRSKRRKSISQKYLGEGKCTDFIHHTQDFNSIKTKVEESIQNQGYRTFLFQSPSFLYECLFVMSILTENQNAIILVPEVTLISNLYSLLYKKFKDRVCIIHGELSRGARSEAIEKILSGGVNIVLGTRSAVFAPFHKVSLIAIFQEHSTSYKQEGGLYYSGRDVAVKRGYFESATVLLSSICPSVESLYNCGLGKYTLLNLKKTIKKPKVRIVNMRNEKLIKPYLSKKVLDASRKYIDDGKKVMFVINRRGHSTIIQCKDCSYIAECPQCKIPLVFHKHDISMKCHYCGYVSSHVPERCSRCNGHIIMLFGAGTQRVQEDIEELVGIKTLRLDADKAKKRAEIEELIGSIEGDKKIIVGTKLLTKRLRKTEQFSLAVILHTDLSLNMPNFRSAEKTYQDIVSVIDIINPDGEILIQTRMPQHYLFKCLRMYDYTSFIKEELSRRKSLRYSPYAHLIVIKCISKRDISQDLSQMIQPEKKDIEILGPYIAKSFRGKTEFRLLLKSSNRESLYSVVKRLSGLLRKLRDVRIKVDVDPVTI